MSKIYQGDDGTVFLVDTGSDVSAATKLSLKVKFPDATLAEWIGAVYDTTRIRFVSAAANLSQVGVHDLQAYIESPDFNGLGDTVEFEIFSPYS